MLRTTAFAVLSTFLALGISSAAHAAEHEASNAADVERLAPSLKPGDVVILKDGRWADQRLQLDASGTAGQPITIRARTPGGVVLTGGSSLTLAGRHLVASGLHFKDVTGEGATIAVPGSHCRVTECAVVNGTSKVFVHLFGTDNRLDHSYLAGKTSESPTVQVEAPAGPPRNCRLDRNHFGPREPLGRNGGETIRVGYSHQQTNDARVVVEDNLFDRCDGELEIISSKSRGNVYRGNTFLRCAGTLTLRHGDRNVVDANVFLGKGKPETGGIRVLGDGHVITNNYVDGVAAGAFWLHAGLLDPQPKDHVRARNCVIAFNTVVDCGTPPIKMSAGYKAPNRVRRPENIQMLNNVFRVAPDGGGGKNGRLIEADAAEGEGFRWAGNLADIGGAASGIDNAAIDGGVAAGRIMVVEDLRLSRADGPGLWRPSPGSPVIDAVAGDAPPRVEFDLDGQPRPAGKGADAGCDEVSDAPVKRRVLGAKDVGPSWLTREAGE